MNKKAMDVAMGFVKKIIDKIHAEGKHDFDLNVQMFLYRLIELQLNQGPSDFNHIFTKIKYPAQITSDCMERLKNLGVVEMIPVDDTYIYDVNLVSKETPCI